MPSRYKLQDARIQVAAGGWRLRTQRTVCQIAAAGDTGRGTLDTWTPISSDTMLATLHSSAWRIRTVSPRCQTGKLSNIPQMVYHDHSPTPHLYLVYIFTLHWIAICVIRIITLCLHVCHELKIGQNSAYGRLVDTCFICRYMRYVICIVSMM